jgi:hypothetical protein
VNTENVAPKSKRGKTAEELAELRSRKTDETQGGRPKNDDPATVKRSRTVTINLRTELFLLEKTGLKSLSQVLENLANQFRSLTTR